MSKAAQQTSDRAPGEGFVVAWVSGSGSRESKVQRLLHDAGTIIEDTPLSSLVDRVNRRAPDLVVLAGAAGSAPDGIVDDLAQRAPASHVPVVAIGASVSAEPKARARYGLVARLDEDAPAEELGKHLRTLLRSLSRRPPRWRIPVRAGGLDVAVDQLTASGRAGLLVGRRGALALGEGGVAPSPVTMSPKSAETLTLYERPRSRVLVLQEAPREEQTAPSIETARVLVVDANAERAAKLAGRLEHGGAQARATKPDAKSLTAAKSLDPTLVVVTADALLGDACAPLWDEPRLAAASLLVLSDDVVRANPAPVLLLAPISALCATELGLAKRLRDGEAVAERLETLGTARWIKILGRVKDSVTLRVYAAAGRGRVDLAEGKMRGAVFRPNDTRMGLVEGRAAIELLMQLPFGRVLAGNPAKLKSLEGVRKSRKTSVVGRITPTKGTGRGAVASELFVERVSKKATNLAAQSLRSTEEPSKEERPTQPARAQSKVVVPKPTAPPPDDEEEDVDDLAALRRELGRVAGVSDSAPAPDAGDEARAERAEAPTDPPKHERKKRKAAKTKVVGAKANAKAPEPDEPISIEALPRPAALPAEAERVASGDEAPRSNTVLYALVATLALAVGAFAAYRLAVGGSGDSPEELRPGPEVAQHVTEPGPTLDPEPTDPDPSTDPEASTPTEPEDVDRDPEAAASADDELTDPEGQPTPIEPPAPGTTVQDLVEGSLEAARASDYARSELLARQALALSPHNAQAAYRLAVALYRRQRYDEAILWAERSEDWDSTSALPASLIGDVCLRTGRFVTAAEAYERALSIEPNFGPAQRQLERLRERRGIGADPQRPRPRPRPQEPPPEGTAPPENPF